MAIPASGIERLLSWFLVFTKPAGERLAVAHLERQGYRVYYPRLLCPTLRRGRWSEKVVALFPRYLFVQLDSARQSLAPVRSTVGVSCVVRFGPEATVVPDSLVQDLIGRADPDSGLHRLGGDRRLQPGTRVSVIAGAFQGLEGVFERMAGSDRVVVLLSLLGRSTPMRMHSGFVVPSPA